MPRGAKTCEGELVLFSGDSREKKCFFRLESAFEHGRTRDPKRAKRHPFSKENGTFSAVRVLDSRHAAP